MDTLIDIFEMTAVGAANEAGLVLGMNEKTVRKWRKDFYTNKGHFQPSKQGKHSRPFTLDDDNLHHKAAQWVGSNAASKGKPNMTAAKFCEWVNSDLLPTADLPPGCPHEIQECTGIKWLHYLGFRPQKYKKGAYIDGHERSDVIEYQKMYLRTLEILESTHLPPPLSQWSSFNFNGQS